MVFRRLLTQLSIGKEVKKQAKKNNEIIFGARSLQRQLGLIGLGRSTFDWDVKTRNSKKSARQLEKTLDKRSGGNYYYSKPALHPGTHKVVDIGPDNKRNTKDDFAIVDYGTLTPGFKTTRINGIRYSTIGQEVKQRRLSLADKESSFRHEKDRRDLALIRTARRQKRFS